MKITLLRNCNLGRMGEVRSVDAPSARALIVLGIAEKYIEPPPKPKRTYKRKTETEEVEKKPRRTYKRKDIVPEPDLTVEDPQPVPEPDAEDDDAPVRLGD